MHPRADAGAIARETKDLLERLGVEPELLRHGALEARSPITGDVIACVRESNSTSAKAAIVNADAAFFAWRMVPAPRRGEFVRLLGDELRAVKSDLARLVTIEAGKTISESLGEVQEMIDICDYAVGLSRQLYGLTIASERPRHRMMETWHPFGVTGVITSFNFPVAVWAWNAALALICGNTVVWKPSEKTPLSALATQSLLWRVAERFDDAPKGLSNILLGGRTLGALLVEDERVRIISATGSTAMGRAVAPSLARRFARAILELGGNNAAIICPSASVDLAVRAIAFAAMGTCGQRCTTLRRLIVHEDIYDNLIGRLRSAYASVSIGDPREKNTLLGPLIDDKAYLQMQEALDEARTIGGTVWGGERLFIDKFPHAYYVKPALVEISGQPPVMQRETFAPVLYVVRYQTIDEAIGLQNGVFHGLASSIFTNDVGEAERFLSAEGSDCGIANVNIGPSGAEIGGAFGGEKDSGGGREAGSDAWKAYMRRATNTINYSNNLPLAQGVTFDVGA